MNEVICWWSGGVTSAVAGLIAVDLYGIDKCRFVFIDTKNEHEDTYRFKNDFEVLIGKEIETISAIGEKYDSIEDVWEKYLSLNVAGGAICSTELKRKVRIEWQKQNEYTCQVFGYDFKPREFNRALGLSLNWPDSKPIFPLLMFSMTKKKCFEYLIERGLEPPVAYSLGFDNNNCLNTGCVQGGVNYWLKYRDTYPDKFEQMAEMEHRLTNEKGTPVTVLKDQSQEAKSSGVELVFLKKHPDFPDHKCLDDMDKSKKDAPMPECNGFCGVDDLQKAYQSELF